MSASTSARVGSAGCAPGLVAASAPAVTARRSAAAGSWPSASATTSAPTNASPAPVVSTGATAGGLARAISAPPR